MLSRAVGSIRVLHLPVHGEGWRQKHSLAMILFYMFGHIGKEPEPAKLVPRKVFPLSGLALKTAQDIRKRTFAWWQSEPPWHHHSGRFPCCSICNQGVMCQLYAHGEMSRGDVASIDRKSWPSNFKYNGQCCNNAK